MKKGILAFLLGLSAMTHAEMPWASPLEIFDKTYLEARMQAFESSKALLIYFTSDACTRCNEQKEMIENDADLRKALEAKFETAIVNVDEFDGNAISQIYQVREAPGYLLVAPNGDVLWRYQGHISKNDLISLTSRERPADLPEGDASIDPAPADDQQGYGYHMEKVEQKTKPVPPPVQVEIQEKSAVPAFQIQFGFFGNLENAGNLRDQLVESGQKDCYIEEEIRNGKTFYRVLSPLYSTQEDAEMILGLVKQKGMEGTIRQIQE